MLKLRISLDALVSASGLFGRPSIPNGSDKAVLQHRAFDLQPPLYLGLKYFARTSPSLGDHTSKLGCLARCAVEKILELEPAGTSADRAERICDPIEETI